MKELHFANERKQENQILCDSGNYRQVQKVKLSGSELKSVSLVEINILLAILYVPPLQQINERSEPYLCELQAK
jgi:hypothetical protein